MVAKVVEPETACRSYDVPLAAAVRPFCSSPCATPKVSSTVVGVTRPERVDKTDEMATYEVPGAPREELAASAAPEEAWLW